VPVDQWISARPRAQDENSSVNASAYDCFAVRFDHSRTPPGVRDLRKALAKKKISRHLPASV
jgi:hypothetical protein